MRIFGFDLLPYPEHLDHLKVGGELPYPLPRKHFRPELAVRTYREHLDAWAFMEELGFEGIGFNEHHTSPYGLMTSPNIMAAAASQRLSRMKILIYGNLLPIHEPLRLAAGDGIAVPPRLECALEVGEPDPGVVDPEAFAHRRHA